MTSMQAPHPTRPRQRRRGRLGLIIALAFVGCARAEIAVIPMPAAVAASDGRLTLWDGAVIRVPRHDPAALFDARWLARVVFRDRRLRLAVRVGKGPASIRLVRSPSEAILGREAYHLDVGPEGATITASADGGLFYGAVTLAQLLTPLDGRQGAVAVPAVRIEDHPRFAWRGLMLDSARHLQSVAFIEALLDQMARYKLNTFHWHLTDDQGWRLQIKAYPRLTSLGGFRVEAGGAAQKDIDPATGRPRLYGGFYTQAEVRQVVAYAKRRNITVVPEIEMPGHASAAILAYPALGVRPVDPNTLSDWGVFPNLYNTDEATFRFLKTVLKEVMALFPGPYVHIGGDEAIKPYWRASPKIQAQIKRLGLADDDALQSWFIQRMERFLAAHGRRLVGWDEILQGGLPSGAVVMSWHGVSSAVAAVKAGHDAVLTPVMPFYFDNRQSDSADEPPGRGLIIDLKRVYDFDPTPTALDPEAQSHILGLQANLWTEHIRLDDRVEHMAFPRAAALAEMAWSPPSVRNWTSFVARLPTALGRDGALGLNPALSAFQVRSAERLPQGGGPLAVTLWTEASLGAVRYTLDGAAPGATSPLYHDPLRLDLPVRLRARAFSETGLPLGPETDRRLDASSLRRRDNHALQTCSDKLVLNIEVDGPVNGGRRAVVLTDVLNPCWIWKGADLSGVSGLTADVAAAPFNFQLGYPLSTIPLGAPPNTDGALEVRLDSCAGPALAILPLTPAVGASGVFPLKAAFDPKGRPADGHVHDLCFVFQRPRLNPMWVLNAVQLEPAGA